MIIKPTIGRVVWFWENEPVEGAQPQAAIVTYVWSDTLVNLSVFDHSGGCGPRSSVRLHQEGEERPVSCFAEWMPFQREQAKRLDPTPPVEAPPAAA